MLYEVNAECVSIEAVAAILHALNVEYGTDCTKYVILTAQEIADGSADDVEIKMFHSASGYLCRCVER